MAAPTWCFSGYCWPLEQAAFVVIGAPLEETVSYRPGTRFAPRAIREASAYIEYRSLRAGIDVDEAARFHDAGDVPGEQPAKRFLEELAYVIEKNVGEKPVFIIGGEHTVTLGVARGLVRSGARPCILQLDAHLDMRDEYGGRRLSHATFMRRLLEEIDAAVLVAGFRGYSTEEMDYARARGVHLIDAFRLEDEGVAAVAPRLESMSKACNHIHVTLDMDVYDPAFAPGVSNPEPEGVRPRIVLDVVFYAARLAARRRLGFTMDVVEVSPPYDPGGVTAILAAKSIIEAAAGYISGGGVKQRG